MNSVFNIISGILILTFLIIGIKYLLSFSTYKLYKPVKWENDVANNLVSKQLIILENEYYDKIRFFSFWFQIKRLKRENIKGDFAELGVHKGETAKIIYEMDPTRKLHLFDTFTGFAEKDLEQENTKGGKYSTKEFSDTNLETVKEYMNAGENVIYYPGYFPSTAIGLDNRKFSFVNIDADLYLPTIEALCFFYSIPSMIVIVN